MKAAVVGDFTSPPQYRDFANPIPASEETLIEVSAAALTPLVKSQASGKHYSSEANLPFIPGVDGVGRRPDGSRVYFAFPTRPYGAMAELTTVRSTLCVPLPDDVDDVVAAAIANPGMSSWASLTKRASFRDGETVLINGATGIAGRLAIQISRHLGARRVIATGRNEASLDGVAEIGADVLIPLDQPPEELVKVFRREIAASGVDVILDYLWGTSAESLIAAISGSASGKAEPRIRYVQIGSIAGPTISLPAAALRSSGLELLGNGLGSLSNESLIEVIGELMNTIVSGKLTINVEPVPLADVETAWGRESAGRIVFTI